MFDCKINFRYIYIVYPSRAEISCNVLKHSLTAVDANIYKTWIQFVTLLIFYISEVPKT